MHWDLTRLYKDLDAWEKDYKIIEETIGDIGSFKGRLDDFETFRDYFLKQREATVRMHKLYQYASLKSHLNTKNVENAARVQKVGHLLNEITKATAFEAPELIALGKDKVMSFIERDDALGEYRFRMEKLFHQQEHVLDGKSEQLLSNYGLLSRQGQEIYNALAVADNTSQKVTLKDGREQTVTHGNYRSLLADLEDADDRETVFKAVFSHYERHKHTYAQIYNTVLQADIARMRSRGYADTLTSYLFSNKIDTAVYHNLVAAAKAGAKEIQRYYAIRKRVLGLKEHRTFDRFMPLATSKSKFSYDEAKALFFKAVDHLGDDFVAKAKDALQDGYVDVFEQDGKVTGAYSWGALNEHPYILLNYDETLNSVHTVAHEAGHSMHSLFASEAQPVTTQQYTIFVAEIASTFNEHVLLDHFIKTNTGTKEDRVVLLQQAIDDILGTFYRQTLFAAYELKAHELAEKGTPITYETLSGIMVDLYKTFYDIDIVKEPGKAHVWAYIPHLFNTPYYVYQYATSFAASLKMYEMVKADVANVEKHIRLMKAGGDDFPVEQVGKAGIDLRAENAFHAVGTRLKTLIDELELALKA